MKKIFFALSTLAFFGIIAPHTFAQGFVPLTNIPGLTSVQPDSAGLASFLNNLYKYLVGLAAVLAVVEIIWGGLEISTQDSVSKNQAGKERIQQAILGLVLVLSPVLVFTIINPSILNLSLNLPPIKQVSGMNTNTGTQTNNGNGGLSVSSTQCTSPTGTVLQQVSCPSSATAQTFATTGCANGFGVVSNVVQQGSCQVVNGTSQCVSIYSASCGQKLAGTFTLVNLGTYFSPKLKPVVGDAAALQSFAASCAQDQGTLCGNRSTFSVSCPSTLNLSLPQGASGSCYSLDSVSCSADSSCVANGAPGVIQGSLQFQ